MRTKYKITAVILLFVGVLIVAAIYLRTVNFAVLNPAGPIAAQERHLLIVASLLTLIVVVPVFAMIIYITWQYRASNTKAKYNPDWDHDRLAETIWWGVPIVLIAILASITWQSSHQLDPFRPLASDKQPLTIQVVALDWKWLFIYPEQNIATVNYIQFPAGRPVNFQITADAPMNSFWVPQLGGQIYAMSGMSTQLHIMADKPGSYRGVSANISGKGFAGMKFIAQSTAETDFNDWVNIVKSSPDRLDMAAYKKLALPSENNHAAFYASNETGLYDKIIMQYMAPGTSMSAMQTEQTNTVTDAEMTHTMTMEHH